MRYRSKDMFPECFSGCNFTTICLALIPIIYRQHWPYDAFKRITNSVEIWMGRIVAFIKGSAQYHRLVFLTLETWDSGESIKYFDSKFWFINSIVWWVDNKRALNFKKLRSTKLMQDCQSMRCFSTVLMIFNAIINLFDHLTSLFSIKRRKCWNLRLPTTNHMRFRVHFLTMHDLIILFWPKHFSSIVLKLIIAG